MLYTHFTEELLGLQGYSCVRQACNHFPAKTPLLLHAKIFGKQIFPFKYYCNTYILSVVLSLFWLTDTGNWYII